MWRKQEDEGDHVELVIDSGSHEHFKGADQNGHAALGLQEPKTPTDFESSRQGLTTAGAALPPNET